MNGLPESYARVLSDLDPGKDSVEATRALLTESEELRAALEHPMIRITEKRRVIDRLFPEAMRNFVKVMCDNQDISCAREMFDIYDRLQHQKDGILHAVFTCVTEPEPEQVERLKRKLMEEYHCRMVNLDIRQDRSLIGGFVLQVGDSVLDRSVKATLIGLRRHLTEG